VRLLNNGNGQTNLAVSKGSIICQTKKLCNHFLLFVQTLMAEATLAQIQGRSTTATPRKNMLVK
jgi:hypothetical protein